MRPDRADSSPTSTRGDDPGNDVATTIIDSTLALLGGVTRRLHQRCEGRGRCIDHHWCLWDRWRSHHAAGPEVAAHGGKASATVASPVAYQALRRVGNEGPWSTRAIRATRLNRAHKQGVVRSLARRVPWRWVSTPMWRRLSSTVTSLVHRPPYRVPTTPRRGRARAADAHRRRPRLHPALPAPLDTPNRRPHLPWPFSASVQQNRHTCLTDNLNGQHR